KAGMQIEKSTLDEIQLETEKAVALDKALTHISATMKTEKQLKDFLVKKGYTEGVINYVLQKLLSYGYINDEEYCKAYINSVSGKGKRAIEAELYKRGAKKSSIENAVCDLEEDQEEVYNLAKKHLRGKEINKINLAKTLKYLMGKGYGYDVAKSAVERIGSVDEDY
ncbi:MAG: regulatory protein RecX, partial [Clostridia bacterium]|nr:regulatory protein RecX [Clostridia bacterium]